MFGEVSNSLGLALAHRDVAQDRAELKAVGALPAGEAGLDRKHLAIAAAAVELDHRAGGELCGVLDGKCGRSRASPRANLVERTADHLLGQIAEDRGRAGIPDRDQVIGIGADQAVAERHRHALKAALGDPAEQIADVDFVERDGRDVDDDGDMKQRGVENERECRLQGKCAGLDGDRRCEQQRHALAGGKAAPREQHEQGEQSEAGQRDDGRSPLQRAVLQQRFRGQRLQHGSGQDDAVRDAEAVAEFERGAADDDLLALQFLQRRRVAAQHVDKGRLWGCPPSGC